MKRIHTLCWALLFSLSLWGQNNPIFHGASADGYSLARQESNAHNPLFLGSREDGYAQQRHEKPQNSRIFKGGIEDGYAQERTGQALNSPIFTGGKEDGYAHWRISLPSNNAIFIGGREDGYAQQRFHKQNHNLIFEGGRDDGFDVYRFEGIPPIVNPNFPVEFLSFEAWGTADGVQLYWVTASEVNFDHFEVERSQDAQVFMPILQQAGAGGPQEIQEYTDLDPRPFSGRSYYRVKAVDLDGSMTYSQTVEITWNPHSRLQLSVYPNPTQGIVHLLLSSQETGQVRITVFDLMGRRTTVPGQTLSLSGQLETELDLSSISSGFYLLQILLTDSGETLSYKVQKY